MYASYQFREFIEQALREDIGTGDLSSSIVPEDLTGLAKLYAKQQGIVAGIFIAEQTFLQVDAKTKTTRLVKDGDKVKPGDVVLELNGSLNSLLQAERTALNFIQHLSGIATATRRAVDLVAGLPVRIIDTRKTLAGWRTLQKYAVRVGGGYNHRFGLYDAVLLKDNHLWAVGGITEAFRLIRNEVGHTTIIQIECENMEQIQEAISCGADTILLDNMTPEQMREAVLYINGRAVVEASGGIKESNLRQVAETGVDLISMGALTHSVQVLDFSLDFGDIKANTKSQLRIK